MSIFDRTDSSFLGQWWWTVDRVLLAAFFVLAATGILLIGTASPPVAELIGLDSYHFLKRHIVILIASFGIMLGVSMLNLRSIRRLSTIMLGAGILALVLVLLVGIEIKGARRWIHLPGFSLQPAEFVKPSFIVFFAWLISLQKTNKGYAGYLVAGVLYALVVSLLLLQPDFGMTFIITSAVLIQIFLAGLPFRFVFILAGIGLSALIGVYFSFDHVRSRVDRFLDPSSGDNFQVDKSIEAFQSGGILGVGPGQGSVKMHLPDAHADFIFAVGGEEMGLVFALFVIGLFSFIILRSLSRIIEHEDVFVMLAAGGLIAMFGLQAFVHMGSSLNILPAKGMTLPLVSYGGSSFLSMGFAMGAVLGLIRRRSRETVSSVGLSLFLSSRSVSKTQ